MIVKQFRLSQVEKERLIRLKAKTGIQQWNVLCRWAFTLSLSMPSTPISPEIPSDSNVELDWHTFGGDSADLYEILLAMRAKDDGYAEDHVSIMKCFRLHLNRGILYLSSKNGPKSSEELLNLVLQKEEK
jgi:DNA sulfur modification protein DndE